MIKKRNLDNSLIQWIMGQSGMGPGVGDIKYLAPTASSTSQYRTWLQTNDTDEDDMFTSLVTAEAALKDGRNDVLVVMPGTYTLTALLTWNNSNTHIIGSHSGSPWSNNIIVQHTAASATSPWLTVSGSDCLIKNIHFKSSGSHANQHTNITNTGSGNHYENCWFEGPTNATQGTDTSCMNVQVDGGGNYFKDCVFGTTAHNTMNGAAQLSWTGSCYRSTFENCIFYQSTASTAGRLLYVAGSGSSGISGPQFFKNCMFVSWWTSGADRCSAAFVGGAGSALGTGMLVFDPNCIFCGFDAIGDTAGNRQFMFPGQSLTADHDGTKAGIVENASGTRP